MTVVLFRKREPDPPRIWECNCGGQKFWLYEDGRVECAECNGFATDMHGYWTIPTEETAG